MMWTDSEETKQKLISSPVGKVIGEHSVIGVFDVRSEMELQGGNMNQVSTPSSATSAPTHEANLARLLMLLKYGGLWFDVDTLFIRPFDPLFSAYPTPFVYGWEYKRFPNNAIIYSPKPQHPIILDLFNYFQERGNGFSFKFDGLTYDSPVSLKVLPCAWFDPMWIQGSPFYTGDRFSSFFSASNEQVSLTNFAPGAFAVHWHNEYDTAPDATSPYEQLLGDMFARRDEQQQPPPPQEQPPPPQSTESTATSSDKEPREVTVISGFWSLEGTASSTHDMDLYLEAFDTTTNVPRPYVMIGNATIGESIAQMRAARNQTTAVHAQDLQALFDLIAEGTGLTVEQIREVASESSLLMPHICPSAEVLMIWLAKPFVMQHGIRLVKEDPTLAGRYADGFAWVDAGYQAYRERVPPAAPWTTFWPRHGIAVRRFKRACHGWRLGIPGRQLLPEDHQECIMGSILYGSEGGWQTFTDEYAKVLRRVVLEKSARELCSDQDLFETVAQGKPWATDEYVSDSCCYGWANARRPEGDEESPHDECWLMKTEYQVQTRVSWGTLPEDKQQRWVQLDCDRRVDEEAAWMSERIKSLSARPRESFMDLQATAKSSGTLLPRAASASLLAQPS